MDHTGCDFLECTGKGVKVAIIDSGIDTGHPEIFNVFGGVSLAAHKNGRIEFLTDYRDNVGHGTACAGIILKKAPEAEIFSIKVFHDESLETEVEVLAEAIRWAADHHMQVVNLSLGTNDIQRIQELREACNYACEKNCILVAADSNDLEDSYPAMLPNVIGVTGGRIKDADSYYYLEHLPVEFAAKGDVQRVAWTEGKSAFMERNSFAAPHITGMVVRILEKYPGSTVRDVKEILRKHAQQGPVKLTIEMKKKINFLKQKFMQDTQENSPKFSWIKKACLYPFNKEMHALVRGMDLLPFTIVSVVDVIGKGTVGKDTGEVLGIEATGLKIEYDLDKALDHADTLILGHVGELSKIKDQDIFYGILEKAVAMGKNVFHLDRITEQERYDSIVESAHEKRLCIATYRREEIDESVLRAVSKLRIKQPVVGVFGTSAQQGKFTTQLALRRHLLKNEYTVAQIGTEPHSELFGFDLGFHIGHNSGFLLPESQYIQYLHYKMIETAYRKSPDIFVVGAQSSIIPFDVDESETVNLRSIAFLLGTKPDAYILTVNNMDSHEYIWRSIHVLEKLCKGKTICLTMSDKEKEVKTIYGLTSIQYRQLTKEELTERMSSLEAEFKIPVTEVVSEAGQQKLFDTVIEYFSTQQEEK